MGRWKGFGSWMGLSFGLPDLYLYFDAVEDIFVAHCSLHFFIDHFDLAVVVLRAASAPRQDSHRRPSYERATSSDYSDGLLNRKMRC